MIRLTGDESVCRTPSAPDLTHRSLGRALTGACSPIEQCRPDRITVGLGAYRTGQSRRPLRRTRGARQASVDRATELSIAHEP